MIVWATNHVLEGKLREVDAEVDLVVEGHHASGQAAEFQLTHTESKTTTNFFK